MLKAENSTISHKGCLRTLSKAEDYAINEYITDIQAGYCEAGNKAKKICSFAIQSIYDKQKFLGFIYDDIAIIRVILG